MAATVLESDTFELPVEIHFLNRISYGPTTAVVAEVQNQGWDNVLESQLKPEDIDTSAIDTILASEFPTLGLTTQQIIDADDPELVEKLIPDLIVSTVLRQVYSPAQLYERMVEFWSDHFNINLLDDRINYLKTSDDRDAVRPNALGKFRDLLHANARSPAMLLYLDNYSNTKEGPNENYARELLELHTLGVDGGYTEADVVEVARAFTGWTISRETIDFTFRMDAHDRRKKTVLGVTLKKTYSGGVTDGEQVLDLLASHPSTARFISAKLIRRFVSDEPDEGLLDELTTVFMDTDGDIKALLRTIFHSEVFWASREMKMKRPLDFLTSAIRRFDLKVSEKLFSYVYTRLKQLGQVPFFWHAPDGYPDTAAYWTNTSALVSRWSTGKDTAYFLPASNYEVMLDGANTPNDIIQAMSVALIDRKLNPQERQSLRKNIFPLLYPNRPMEGDPVPYARTVATVLLGSRYFQMR